MDAEIVALQPAVIVSFLPYLITLYLALSLSFLFLV